MGQKYLPTNRDRLNALRYQRQETRRQQIRTQQPVTPPQPQAKPRSPSPADPNSSDVQRGE
jgi:hypothetical protein